MPTQSTNTQRARPRIFERNLRPPSKASAEARDQGGKARSYEYERLVRVMMRNGYYNSSGGVCPDFLVYPTPETARLMASLGLLLRSEVGSFSVLFDRQREASLLSYLRRQVVEESVEERRGTPGVWTRLTFMMVNENPFFVNLTNIPIDTNPSEVNFYFSNREAHREGVTTLLTPGTQVAAAELLPVVSTQVVVPVDEGVEEVEVVAISGEVVLAERALGRKRVFLDFSLLPEDKYHIRLVRGEEVEAATTGLPVLYTSFEPMPLALIDLFFTDPTLEGPGIFPVRQLFEPERSEIVPTDYELRFGERSTQWIYYIVPDAKPWRFSDLEIKSESVPPIVFLGPEMVVLKNGTVAFRFVSEEPIPLFQKSPTRLRLEGVRDGRETSEVLVRRLPVASPQEVRPGVPCETAIYVYL